MLRTKVLQYAAHESSPSPILQLKSQLLTRCNSVNSVQKKMINTLLDKSRNFQEFPLFIIFIDIFNFELFVFELFQSMSEYSVQNGRRQRDEALLRQWSCK